MLQAIHEKSTLQKYPRLESLFRKAMFWDVHVDKLSIKKDKEFIIDRVLAGSMLNPRYLENLEKLYPVDLIKRVAIESNSIRGNEIIRFIANRYGMAPESFRLFIPGI